MQKKIGFIILIIILPAFCFSARFAFKDRKGDRFIITTHTVQEILINNSPVLKVDMRHKGELLVTEETVVGSIIKGKYDFYQRPVGDTGVYMATSNRSYETEYKRKPDGNIAVKPEYFYPVIRNVPFLPDRELKSGETWEAEGEEVQDFRKRGIENPYKYKIRVFYKYGGDIEKDGKKLSIIEFFYYVNQKTEHIISFNARDGLIPARFFGFVNGIYYWDREKYFATSYKSDYNFVFINKNGSTNEYKGVDEGKIEKVAVITQRDEDNIITELNRTIRNRDIPVEIKRDDRGVALNFSGKVLFDFGSYKLSDNALSKLKEIAETLKELIKKHPGIEFRVEGHSDSIGTSKRKQYFSDQRSKVVANYLASLGIDPTKLSFQGFSDSKPVAPNSTSEGREKNRRVEIIIQTR